MIEMRRIGSNFAEDWNLIGGLGAEVPQKRKLFSYWSTDSSIFGEFHSSYNLSVIGILSVKKILSTVWGACGPLDTPLTQFAKCEKLSVVLPKNNFKLDFFITTKMSYKCNLPVCLIANILNVAEKSMFYYFVDFYIVYYKRNVI